MSNTIRYTLYALGVLLALSFASFVAFEQADQAVGAVGHVVEYRDATATTTRTSLLSNATASTSIYAAITDAHRADFNICAVGSSSAALLKYDVAYSFDATVASSTWFGETSEATSAGAVTHSRAVHTFSLATTTLGTNYVCANLPVANTGAKWVRIKMGVMGANATIWRSIVPKVEI